MGICPAKRYAACLHEPLGVGKGYAGNTPAKATGVDAQYQKAFAAVVVVFFVESRGYLEDFLCFLKRVHYADARRQGPRKL